MRLPMTGLYVYPSFPDVRVGILPIFSRPGLRNMPPSRDSK